MFGSRKPCSNTNQVCWTPAGSNDVGGTARVCVPASATPRPAKYSSVLGQEKRGEGAAGGNARAGWEGVGTPLLPCSSSTTGLAALDSLATSMVSKSCTRQRDRGRATGTCSAKPDSQRAVPLLQLDRERAASTHRAASGDRCRALAQLQRQLAERLLVPVCCHQPQGSEPCGKAWCACHQCAGGRAVAAHLAWYSSGGALSREASRLTLSLHTLRKPPGLPSALVPSLSRSSARESARH